MRNKKLTFILHILLFSFYMTKGQSTLKGHVMDQQHQSLIGAAIFDLASKSGVITGVDGTFSIAILQFPTQLVVSYVGYKTDTITVTEKKPIHIMLDEDETELGTVVISSSSTFFDKLEPRHSEIITEKELQKAACCNLSESFETNASVDVSFSDAISGAKMIRMLGLDGRYVQINRENIPQVRGLTGRYGLGYIPGTWIQSIDVGKGAGSVVNGFESMSGQINLEFKKPESDEKWYFNAYANSFGRAELNVNQTQKLNDRWSMAWLTHVDYFGNSMDPNGDGFLEMPLSRQINVLNRYKYDGDRVVNQLGIHVMRDQKAGGQVGFGFDDNLATSPLYGFVNNTTSVELFGKTGILFPAKPYKGIGIIYSGKYNDISGGFGRNLYTGKQTGFYGNMIYQSIIDNSFHQYKTGVSIQIEDYQESFADSTFNRTEIIPGGYFEYSYLPGDQFTLVAGGRIDFHNMFGIYATPRLHLRYELGEKTTLRGSIGRGYRTPNIVVENSPALVSARRLILLNDLQPEVSWNAGGSMVNEFKVANRKISLVTDYFYTWFENQMVFDMDINPGQINVYNLVGQSFAHSFQFEAGMELTPEWQFKAAYKRYDVRTTLNGKLQQQPFIPADRIFFNTSYATRFEKWKGDLTVQWFGSQRLPDTDGKPAELRRDPTTPDYFLVNGQISRGLRWGSIYIGGENLLNFVQKNPIIDADNPFSDQFDASLIWAPVMGRMIYAGFRYKIKH